ncbi:SRPBCC family protein [Haloarculaceae archaeon H-GB2-1]|nr:SRPBCC family protein [Haloarculaceae archaeon H-GB1-1]MEA5387347.1 SRPBCC family protein [Haloarculaceae archaeon H-GB11]MEA5408816.1 SRPBCC family protein [Haloarculaceae archaeon H-GB2-1]
MTVRVERVFEIPAPIQDVWEFIADPEKRAAAISVVRDYSVEDGNATWNLKLPIPLLDRTVAVETRDTDRREPEYVRFVGRSRVMNVSGEHELTSLDGTTRVTNTFVVEGKIPGVERFFNRNMDTELDNLERALFDDLGVEA